MEENKNTYMYLVLKQIPNMNGADQSHPWLKRNAGLASQVEDPPIVSVE